MSHLGDAVSALVDGQHGHGQRERALSHLAHCADCRADVEAARQVKARVQGLGEPAPSSLFQARLLSMAVDPQAPVDWRPPPLAMQAGALPDSRPSRRAGDVQPTGGWTDRPGRRSDDVRPSRPASRIQNRPGRAVSRRGERLRRAGIGGALAALGLGAALVLGGPARDPAPVFGPAGDPSFQDVRTTTDTPLPDPALQAGLVTTPAGP